VQISELLLEYFTVLFINHKNNDSIFNIICDIKPHRFAVFIIENTIAFK